jgi:hypothetical protein
VQRQWTKPCEQEQELTDFDDAVEVAVEPSGVDQARSLAPSFSTIHSPPRWCLLRGPTSNATFSIGTRAELPARLVDAGLLHRGAKAARCRGVSTLLRDKCQTRFIVTCGHTPRRFWMTKVSNSVNNEACPRPTTGEGLDDADA